MTSLTDKMGDWEREYRQDRHNSYGSAMSLEERIESEIAFITKLLAAQREAGAREEVRIYVTAMGMISENMQRQALSQSMAYTEEDFLSLTPPTK